jgi:FAD/FMN-containing dehydrogenase
MAEFEHLDDLARGVQRVFVERYPVPILMEMMAQDAAEIGYRTKGLEPPGGSIVMFAESGFSEDEASKKVKKVLEAFDAEKAKKTYYISDMETWHKIWGAREVIGPYLMQRNGDMMNAAEVVSNLKDLVEFVDDCANFNKGLPLLGQLDNYLYGHIGALTLHPTFLIPRDWDKKKKRQVVDETFKRETEINLKYDAPGGEWGQFSLRTPFFIKKYGEIGYGLVKGLKNMLDPNNILNPGILEGYR